MSSFSISLAEFCRQVLKTNFSVIAVRRAVETKRLVTVAAAWFALWWSNRKKHCACLLLRQRICCFKRYLPRVYMFSCSRGEWHVGRIIPMTSGNMEGGNVLWGGEERVRELLIIYFLIFGFFFHRSLWWDVSLRRVNCCQPTSTVSWGTGGSECFFSCHFLYGAVLGGDSTISLSTAWGPNSFEQVGCDVVNVAGQQCWRGQGRDRAPQAATAAVMGSILEQVYSDEARLRLPGGVGSR